MEKKTKLPKAPTKGASAVYDFRCNEDMYTSDELLKFMKFNCKKFVFQKEKGDTGYVHWQGRFSLIKKRSKSLVMQLFDKNKVPNYLEPTSSEHSCNDIYFYAFKEDTRVLGPFCDEKHQKILGIDEIFIPRQFKNLKLYPWQQHLIDSISTVPHTRTINYVYDKKGNKGKSTISALVEIQHGGIDIPISLDPKDLINSVCNICMDMETRDPRILLFDMPRSLDKKSLSGLFTALETIKKGKLYDFRHHYTQYWIDTPHLWVFSNEPLPKKNYLSADRWVKWRINDKMELVSDRDTSSDSSDSD